jgi:hypothetical protein
MAEATVHVWMMQRQNFGTGVQRTLGVGHAALRLITENNQKHYITWSAKGHPLFDKQGNLQFVKPRYKGLGKEKFGYDKGFEEDQDNMYQFFGDNGTTGNESNLPDYTINLPTLSVSRNGFSFGVAVNRIESFWGNRLQEPNYSFLSKKLNCTGCVAEALKAGGLGCFVEKENNLFVQDARTLRVWAQKGAEKLDSLNKQQTSINAVMEMWSQKYPNLLGAGVPSFQDWKRDSDAKVKFGSFAQRKDQIAKLDFLIRNYPNAQSNLSRFTYLIKMQCEIYSHFINKPNSDRKEAVRDLGVRVTGALRNLNLNASAINNLSDDDFKHFMGRLAWDTDSV